MMKQGIVIEIGWSFLLIVIISLLLGKVDSKLTCMAYVVAILYFIDWFLVKVGIKKGFFALNYNQLIYLAGLLHMIEGILTFFKGAQSSYPIMTYRGKITAGGYQAYGRWIIPLLFFSINGIYVPLIAAIIYCNESFVLTPEEKAKKMGLIISSYGLAIMIIARLVAKQVMFLELGIISMPLLHELIFLIDTYIEKGPLKYAIPTKGIRVMDILGKHHLNINRGDIIRKLNEQEILQEETYYEELEHAERVVVEIEKLGGKKVKVSCTARELKAEKLIFLPPY